MESTIAIITLVGVIVGLIQYFGDRDKQTSNERRALEDEVFDIRDAYQNQKFKLEACETRVEKLLKYAKKATRRANYYKALTEKQNGSTLIKVDNSEVKIDGTNEVISKSQPTE
jgi:archaellum component FlaC